MYLSALLRGEFYQGVGKFEDALVVRVFEFYVPVEREHRMRERSE